MLVLGKDENDKLGEVWDVHKLPWLGPRRRRRITDQEIADAQSEVERRVVVSRKK